MQFSQYQIDIFNAVKNTNSNICVQAGPGSGKTSSLLEIAKLIPITKKSIFVSFSNTIVNELKSRVPTHIKACTLHSLGYGMITAYYKKVQVDNDKWFKKLADELTAEEKQDKNNFRICGEVVEIINYARLTLTSPTEELLIEMCNYYSLEYKSKTISKAIECLSKSEKWISKVDFTDMIYLPATDNKLINQQYDYVLYDEVQDANSAQLALIEKIIRPGGRLIAVGDEKQSIFSFAGGSVESFNKVQQRPNTITLPLSISYRCAKNIVKEAKKIYNNIEAYEGNEEGIVRVGELHEVKEGDMVVCRKTAPLISGFFKLIAKNIKAVIVGKDIESGLLSLAERVQSSNSDQTLQKIEDEKIALMEELKILGFLNIKDHPRFVSLLEKIEVIKLILKNIKHPNELTITIKNIFREDKKAVKMMTIHRSKGLECDRVFVIDRFNQVKLSPSPYAINPWDKIQESNLQFVAFTRAKRELVYVDLKES